MPARNLTEWTPPTATAATPADPARKGKGKGKSKSKGKRKGRGKSSKGVNSDDRSSARPQPPQPIGQRGRQPSRGSSTNTVRQPVRGIQPIGGALASGIGPQGRQRGPREDLRSRRTTSAGDRSETRRRQDARADRRQSRSEEHSPQARRASGPPGAVARGQRKYNSPAGRGDRHLETEAVQLPTRRAIQELPTPAHVHTSQDSSRPPSTMDSKGGPRTGRRQGAHEPRGRSRSEKRHKSARSEETDDKRPPLKRPQICPTQYQPHGV